MTARVRDEDDQNESPMEENREPPSSEDSNSSEDGILGEKLAELEEVYQELSEENRELKRKCEALTEILSGVLKFVSQERGRIETNGNGVGGSSSGSDSS